jgi:hypothetical protein
LRPVLWMIGPVFVVCMYAWDSFCSFVYVSLICQTCHRVSESTPKLVEYGDRLMNSYFGSRTRIYLTSGMNIRLCLRLFMYSHNTVSSRHSITPVVNPCYTNLMLSTFPLFLPPFPLKKASQDIEPFM